VKNAIRLAVVLCAVSAAAFAGVTIKSPANGAVANSPLHVVASATPISSAPVTVMQIYIDGALKYQANGAYVDTYVTVSGSSHQVAVKEWDSVGANALATVNVTASGSGVTLSSPVNNQTVYGSVQVVGSAFSPYGITAVQIYDNGNLVYKTTSGSINQTLGVSQGSHYIMVQAWDRTGTIFFHPVTVNSTTGAPAPAPTPAVARSTGDGPQAAIPGNAVAKIDVDQMAGWQSCDACAGQGGAGPVDPYSMTQNINTPSLDGRSATFWLGGNVPFGAALWWKQLGAIDSATHFVYDVEFFINNPHVSQALEFDINQSVNGLKYIFGTECDVRNGAGFRVWDTKNAHWMSTGASCQVRANAWNHLTWEVERVGNQTHFIAVTLNGYRQTINRYYYARPIGNVRELNVAFQMDGDEYQDDYQAWLDRVRLYAW
jgi:Bacterial Ig domain